MRPHASTATLVDVIRHHAAERGKRVACELLPSSDHAGLTLTYEELDARACAIAGQLRARGASEQPVLVLCPAGLDYVAALFGCFYAGAVAVPAYPPTRTSLARTLPRLTAIAADAGAKWALVASEVGELGASALSAALACVELLEICREAAADPDARSPSADQPALLQYTSGSTASPKGVLLSHAQLLQISR